TRPRWAIPNKTERSFAQRKNPARSRRVFFAAEKALLPLRLLCRPQRRFVDFDFVPLPQRREKSVEIALRDQPLVLLRHRLQARIILCELRPRHALDAEYRIPAFRH